MTTIPDDIMKSARDCYEGLLNTVLVYDGWDEDAFVANIALALMAERERCAKIAEDLQLIDHPRLSPGAEINAWWSGQEIAAETISASIRGGAIPPSSASSSSEHLPSEREPDQP